MQDSSLMCVLDAWVHVLGDFRAWFKPETPHGMTWKQAPLSQSIKGVKAKLIDDVEGMIADWRANKNDTKEGQTSKLPVLLTAVAETAAPPEISQVIGQPYWTDVIVPNDPQERVVQMRTIPKAVRAQVVYITSNPHDASSISDQFCAYMTDDNKRRFAVNYHLGGGLVSDFKMTVLENSLFPDSAPSDAKNLTIITVDVTMIGLVPHVVGLGGEWDSVTDVGVDPDNGDVGGDNATGGGQKPADQREAVVIRANLHDEEIGRHNRVDADPVTGEITDTEVDAP